MHIRQETPTDASAIARTVERAFAGHPHSVGNEVAIICGLRTAKALSVSLVADVNGRVRGYVAASPVQVAGRPSSWFGLGPVAVDPAVQRQGIGGVLVNECLDRLRSAGASGCVVLGDPAYYGRFGFEAHTGLSYKGHPQSTFWHSLSAPSFRREKFLTMPRLMARLDHCSHRTIDRRRFACRLSSGEAERRVTA